MLLYMTQFSYTAEATAAMVENPQDRSGGLKQIIETLGGRLIGLYYSLGDYDGIGIVEVPDQVTELALAFAITAPGHLKAMKTTTLFTMEQAVAAMKKANALTYAGPEA